MIGEIAFNEEQDKVEMLAKIVATLHWAAPIVARSCRTGVEHIVFFGPRKALRKGQTLLIYRLARVYGPDPVTLRESVWRHEAVSLDLENENVKKRLNRVKKHQKQTPSFKIKSDSESQIEDAACLG